MKKKTPLQEDPKVSNFFLISKWFDLRGGEGVEGRLRTKRVQSQNHRLHLRTERGPGSEQTRRRIRTKKVSLRTAPRRLRTEGTHASQCPAPSSQIPVSSSQLPAGSSQLPAPGRPSSRLHSPSCQLPAPSSQFPARSSHLPASPHRDRSRCNLDANAAYLQEPHHSAANCSFS